MATKMTAAAAVARVHEAEVLGPDPQNAKVWRFEVSDTVEGLTGLVLELTDRIGKSRDLWRFHKAFCGVALLRLKAKVGHGKWETFFRENIERAGLSYTYAKLHMAVAKKVLKVMGEEQKTRLLTSPSFGQTDASLLQRTVEEMPMTKSWVEELNPEAMKAERLSKSKAPPEQEPTHEDLREAEALRVAMDLLKSVEMAEKVVRRGEHSLLKAHALKELLDRFTEVRMHLKDEWEKARKEMQP
jgi:hypothetical protein